MQQRHVVRRYHHVVLPGEYWKLNSALIIPIRTTFISKLVQDLARQQNLMNS